ncbi:hypothetical protein GQ367_08495 [Polynucleobacter sp. MWH-CaK5]|uniref:hypothetical protein n=1 Tax=Polynucleobacter sp. MWH-CaK5 TaxID=2689107 RepID=UPI001BFDE721|nr:hypothetical protein [Polynucleobacter sp. MWH-CaK5]QWD88900.1 hypothetical protein GQ367_08495 [Polynucleobacter sp. MWH-CaK5]
MRLYEIASAEEQMALLKLIMDNTWQALVTQARQQAQQTAKKRAAKPATTTARKAIPVKAYRAALPKKPLPVATAQSPAAIPKASNDSKPAFDTQKLVSKQNVGDGEEGYS